MFDASKSHQWFKSYGYFTEGVDCAYWWSFIGKGLRLQPAQQACFFASVCLAGLLYQEAEPLARPGGSQEDISIYSPTPPYSYTQVNVSAVVKD